MGDETILYKQQAARRAVEFITSGIVLGLGYGSTAAFAVQDVAELIQAGKLAVKKPVEGTVTYHDPCYLGRHNDVFDAPRAVLHALPGITLKEMIRTREQSLCCGGGGGRMWVETKVGERFSDLRIPEALAVGANVLATACPYCVNMFESSRVSLGSEDAIQVKDLTELVAESLA